MNVLFQTRIDALQKKAAEQLFRRMGMTLGGAFRMFIAQSLNDKALPFQPTTADVPNAEMRRAMAAAENREQLERFESVQDLMSDLTAQDDA